MKMTFCSIISIFALLSCGSPNSGTTAAAMTAVEVITEDALIEWDKVIHDFGDISVEDGPVCCSFTLTNLSDKPIAVYEVVSSCGCTGVSWTKEPIQKGKSGTITATYKNEDGPNAFDKTLTVYISGIKKPVILRIRGVVHEKKKSLNQLYGEQRLGDFGMKKRAFEAPVLRQGLKVSTTADVANLGKVPLSVSFADISPNLSITVSPNPIPAGSTAVMTFTISADRNLWGRNSYSAVPVLGGRKTGEVISVSAVTQENFSQLSKEEKASAPWPMFTTSTFEFGTVRRGRVIKGEFVVDNRGKAPLHFFKADTETPSLTVTLPADTPPSGKAKVAFSLDTSALPAGETVIMASLVTNSPLRPVVNLFVAGFLE